MSNIYIQEPPTNGKVSLETSVGDIEIELWSRECPKACRNFVQLCMENYYNKTKFHRVVKDFIVQGGDPGNGGESIYGQPFKDEFHSRLRFVRRGLVAMANAGKDDNGSQFFFTMGPSQELQNKHTIFGKVVGDTVYNMVKLQEGEIDEETERPTYPNKILRTHIISNPFPDIEPRTTIQMLKNEDEENTHHKKKSKSKMKATKDFNLISFGEEAEEEENDLDTVQESYRNKSKSSHDLLNDPKLSSEIGNDEMHSSNKHELSDNEDENSINTKKMKSEEDHGDLTNIRNKLQKSRENQKKATNKSSIQYEDGIPEDENDEELNAQKRKRDEIKREIMALKREMKGMKDKKARHAADEANDLSEEAISTENEEKNDMLKSFHQEQKKYASKKVPKKGSSREEETMALLAKFKQKLGSAQDKHIEIDEVGDKDEEVVGDSWMFKELKFQSDDPVLAKDANTKDDDWFDIYDPRNPLNKRRREKKKT